jgi:hypothetical protein
MLKELEVKSYESDDKFFELQAELESLNMNINMNKATSNDDKL